MDLTQLYYAFGGTPMSEISSMTMVQETPALEQATDGGEETTNNDEQRPKKSLLCKRCRGHGKVVPLRKHSSKCPYINCSCKMCNKVMADRVAVMLRRYRNHTGLNELTFKPVRFSNGNIRFRVFEKGECEDGIPFIEGQEQSPSPSDSTASSLPLLTPPLNSPDLVQAQQFYDPSCVPSVSNSNTTNILNLANLQAPPGASPFMADSAAPTGASSLLADSVQPSLSPVNTTFLSFLPNTLTASPNLTTPSDSLQLEPLLLPPAQLPLMGVSVDSPMLLLEQLIPKCGLWNNNFMNDCVDPQSLSTL